MDAVNKFEFTLEKKIKYLSKRSLKEHLSVFRIHLFHETLHLVLLSCKRTNINHPPKHFYRSINTTNITIYKMFYMVYYLHRILHSCSQEIHLENKDSVSVHWHGFCACCLYLCRCSCHSQAIAFGGGWEISEVQAVHQAGVRARQPQSDCCASHTWNRAGKTAATDSAPAPAPLPAPEREEQGMTATDLCAPSTHESGGGCEAEHRKGQNISKKSRGQTSW